MSTMTAIRQTFLALACSVLGSCTNGASAEQSSPVLVGTVIHVYDGDTIKVRLSSGPIIVRLHSIDTPEHDQPWGPQAAAALAGRIAGRKVSLEVVTQDSYDRFVADVLLGDESINAWMVKQGDAWAYRHYMQDRDYCAWEGEARAARRGLWSQSPGTWRAPWQWRVAARGVPVAFTDYSHETVARCVAAIPVGGPPTTASASTANADTSGAGASVPAQPRPGNCLIKGNISSNGRIYHLPGTEPYDGTRIDESKGERWFCTEAEARAAGWRPAGSR